MSNEEMELQDIINSALNELSDPSQDNPETAEVQNEVTEETVEDAVDEVEPDGDEPESEQDDEDVYDKKDADKESDETDIEPDFLSEKVVVKVDGKESEITVKEALEGYQRREDYTRKTQELSEARQAFEQEIQEYSETLENVAAFETSWADDPAGVISRMASGTDNPTQALVLTIKNLAAQNLLEKDFLDIFGITKEVIADWSKEAELAQAKSKVSSYEKRDLQAKAEQDKQDSVQQAMSRFEKQVDNIINNEGISFNDEQRKEFTQALAAYAFENNLTNLEAARKAMLFDESQKKQQVTEQTRQRVSQKRKASAVTRTGSSGGGSPVGQEPSDLRSLIESTMREIS